MNTVLVQEAVRYNRLLKVMSINCRELGRALRGEVILSTELEGMANSLFINAIPGVFKADCFPSLKPLSSWTLDLVARCSFIQKWYESGTPSAFWMGGFFFPQAFLTATLQNYARRIQQAIDTISFDFDVQKQEADTLAAPSKGAYIYGLFLEGARWNADSKCLVESRQKELFTQLPPIYLNPIVNRPAAQGVYLCPVYKTLTRAGTLSTTGHSTNFVLSVELPAGGESDAHWIKRGVACIVTLDT